MNTTIKTEDGSNAYHQEARLTTVDLYGSGLEISIVPGGAELALYDGDGTITKKVWLDTDALKRLVETEGGKA